MPTGVYIFTPCREPWVPRSVDLCLPRMPVLDKYGQPKHDKNGKLITISATTWLAQNRRVIQVTWAPGRPMLIEDCLVVDGGWIERKDVTSFNLYRPPLLAPGDATAAGPWLDHVNKIFDAADADHIIKWLAQRVQQPAVKINHALVLGGAPGVGKDSLLAPIKHAVGPWNFHDIQPTHLLGDFNGFAKSVILRVNEARDLGSIDRFAFYDKTKNYLATPPEVIPVNEKYLRGQWANNCVGCIFTTNYRTDGIYLPADDRRHFIAWTQCTEADFKPEYWNELWSWYEQKNGFNHVAAYLAALDLSGFDPKAPPPKTAAFWDIVLANAAPEDAELMDVIDALGKPDPSDPNHVDAPDIVTKEELLTIANGSLAEWLSDRRNRRALPHRMERCGYVAVKNPKARDGLWKVKGARRVIYARRELTVSEQLDVVYRKVVAAPFDEARGV
jgi:hypothetical protein